MIYLLSGSLTVSSGYKRRTFFPGDLLLFNSNEIHSTLSEVSDTTAYVLQIPHGLFQPYYPSGETSVFEVPAVSSGTLSCDASAQISHLKELILTCYELQSRRPELYQILIMNNIYRILYILFHSFSVFQRQKYDGSPFHLCIRGSGSLHLCTCGSISCTGGK